MLAKGGDKGVLIDGSLDCFEFVRVLKAAADPERDQGDQAAGKERDAPSVAQDVFLGHARVDDGADQVA